MVRSMTIVFAYGIKKLEETKICPTCFFKKCSTFLFFEKSYSSNDAQFRTKQRLYKFREPASGSFSALCDFSELAHKQPQSIFKRLGFLMLERATLRGKSFSFLQSLSLAFSLSWISESNPCEKAVCFWLRFVLANGTLLKLHHASQGWDQTQYSTFNYSYSHFVKRRHASKIYYF